MMTSTTPFPLVHRPRRAAGVLALGVILAASVAALQAQRASASSTTLTVSGSFTGQAATATPPACLSTLLICEHSTLTGTLAGTLDSAVLAFLPSLTPGVLFANSTSVLHTSSGDLQFKESAAFNSLSSEGEFSSLFEITGGTGHYTGASGYFTAHGTSTIALLGSPATPFSATDQGAYVGKVVIP